MESITYIAEATALIEGIHILKQWTYDGTAQLLIPACTLVAVEEAYKAPIVPKDASKQLANKKEAVKTRETQNLFDINPRTALEFLERARTEDGVKGVTFQKEGEVFTQWKNEEEIAAAKSESPLQPPTSFAEALARKLAAKDETKEAKAPSKPKLTAKSKETKTVFKVDKIPVLSSQGLADSDKALLSCALWRVHEAERNPLEPVKYVLLNHKKQIRQKAIEFGLAYSNIDYARKQHVKQNPEIDARNDAGQLEDEFPEILAISQRLRDPEAGPKRKSKSSAKVREAKTKPVQASETTGPNGSPSNEVGTNYVNEAKESIAAPAPREALPPKINPWAQRSQVVPMQQTEQVQEILQNVIQTVRRMTNSDEPRPEINLITPTTDGKELKADSAAESSALPELQKTATDSDSELESDEEIIVFAPRNRRISGHPSRPGSSNGVVPKTYKAGVLTASRPTTSGGLSRPISLDGQVESLRSLDGMELLPDTLIQSIEDLDVTPANLDNGLKTPSDSKLKAQSPVFTPGQPFIPSPLGASQPESPARTPIPTGPRNPTLRHQRSLRMQQETTEEMLRVQKENSHRIIQRQREAVLRHSRSGTPTSEQASPRIVQMEPTNTPTIIDPDAFDRSYVVQAPSKSNHPRQNGSMRRGRGNHHHVNNHSHRSSSGRNSPREPPKENGSPKDAAEVDYVLKSGNPRGSSRGGGKLWVP